MIISEMAYSFVNTSGWLTAKNGEERFVIHPTPHT